MTDTTLEEEPAPAITSGEIRRIDEGSSQAVVLGCPLKGARERRHVGGGQALGCTDDGEVDGGSVGGEVR